MEYNSRIPGDIQTKLIIAIVCGVVAFFLPVPILDLILAAVAIILVVDTKKMGAEGALWITALVISIIGALSAVWFNILMLFLGSIFRMF